MILKHLVILFSLAATEKCIKSPESKFWEARYEASKTRYTSPVKKPAKNVILFVGDGMGLATVTAARLHAGVQKKTCSTQNEFFFENNLPYSGLSKTYNLEKFTADSASTATAMMTGIKVNHLTVGMGRDPKIDQEKLPHISKVAKSVGKTVGVVTTTQVLHATPASMY